MIRELIMKNRSYRRFDSSVKISAEQLLKWIDLARYAASGRNAQPIKYVLSTSEETNQSIFPCLVWAAFLTDWDGPGEHERPTAYAIQLLDKTIADNYYCDDGIAAQNILLGAIAEGFGGCILRAVNRPKLMKVLKLSADFEIINVIALGKPSEDVVIEPMVDGNFKYWRDSQGVHHVPKRSLDEIVIQNHTETENS
jgi:nitroreductase